MKNREYTLSTTMVSTDSLLEVANIRSKGIQAVSLTSETSKGEKSEVIIFFMS